MELNIALQVDEKDNVATIFADGITKGTSVRVKDRSGYEDMMSVTEVIPYGHKVAVRDIQVGEPIIKYGESIGRAVRDIKKGDYVHVHNMEAMRGRGDL